jgi:hypothetical protein
MDSCPPSAWNDSWDDAQNNPSAAGAVSAFACAIVAVSACAACEHTSCKRQASGSNPLTGSQFGDRLYLASARFRGTPSVAEGRMEQLPGGSFRVCVYAGTDPLIGVRSA